MTSYNLPLRNMNLKLIINRYQITLEKKFPRVQICHCLTRTSKLPQTLQITISCHPDP